MTVVWRRFSERRRTRSDFPGGICPYYTARGICPAIAARGSTKLSCTIKNMKTISFLCSITLFFCGYVNAQSDGHAKEKPAIFSITPAALEYFIQSHEVRSKNRSKDVSLLLADSAMAFNPKGNIRYSIKIENLVFIDVEPPAPESISITIQGRKCWITPTLLNRLQRSTIDIVDILSTDVMSNTRVLILRPTDPIIREIIEPESK